MSIHQSHQIASEWYLHDKKRLVRNQVPTKFKINAFDAPRKRLASEIGRIIKKENVEWNIQNNEIITARNRTQTYWKCEKY